VFWSVIEEKHELTLGNHKYDKLNMIESQNTNYTYLISIISFYHKILQKSPLKDKNAYIHMEKSA
jgi:hypothetical protein